MAVYVETFPACCTARVLHNFGESGVAAGGSHSQDYDSMKTQVEREIQRYRDDGLAMLTATTNNDQVTANAVLRDLGFKRTKWMKKDLHPETRVCLWWLPLKAE